MVIAASSKPDLLVDECVPQAMLVCSVLLLAGGAVGFLGLPSGPPANPGV